MKMKLFSAMLLLLISFSVFYPVALAAEQQLAVIPVVQGHDSYCWAACAEMSGKFYYKYKTGLTSSRTQFGVIGLLVPNDPYGGGTPLQTADGCRYIAYNNSNCLASPYYYGSTYAWVRNTINSSKPLIIGVLWGDLAHMLTVYGYRDDSGTTTKGRLLYIDPADGKKKSIHIDTLGANWKSMVHWIN